MFDVFGIRRNRIAEKIVQRHPEFLQTTSLYNKYIASELRAKQAEAQLAKKRTGRILLRVVLGCLPGLPWVQDAWEWIAECPGIVAAGEVLAGVSGETAQAIRDLAEELGWPELPEAFENIQIASSITAEVQNKTPQALAAKLDLERLASIHSQMKTLMDKMA